MEKVENRGGRREGAGRKPTDNPLVPVYVSIKTSVVETLGGREEVRTIAQKYLNNKSKRIKKLKENTNV